MPKFRKKPVEIEAMPWDGSRASIEAICRWANEGADEPHVDYLFTNADDVHDVLVSTLEGPLNASPGDWIIRGVKGEFYPCKPDVFEATYSASDDEAGPDPLDRAVELLKFSDQTLAAVMGQDHRGALGTDVSLVLALQAIACALVSHADAHQVRRAPVQADAG